MAEETLLIGHDYELRETRVRLLFDGRGGFDGPLVRFASADGDKHWLDREIFLREYVHASGCSCAQIEQKAALREKIMVYLIALVDAWASSWGMGKNMPRGAQEDLAKMICNPKPVPGPLPYRERKDDRLIALTKSLRTPRRRS